MLSENELRSIRRANELYYNVMNEEDKMRMQEQLEHEIAELERILKRHNRFPNDSETENTLDNIFNLHVKLRNCIIN